MWSAPLLPSLPSLFWLGVVALNWALYMGTIELFDILNCVQTNDLYEIELLEIEQFGHLTACKQMTDVQLCRL